MLADVQVTSAIKSEQETPVGDCPPTITSRLEMKAAAWCVRSRCELVGKSNS